MKEVSMWSKIAPGVLQHSSGLVQIVIGVLKVDVTGVVPQGTLVERPVYFVYARGALSSQYDRLLEAKNAGVILVQELLEVL